MIKAMFLILRPGPTWDQLAEAGRGMGFIFAFYLMPMLLIVGATEGFGLVHWGVSQMNSGLIKKLSVNEAVIYEAAQTLLMLLLILIGTALIKLQGETFHSRANYKQAFTVVAYGLSPLFLIQSLNVFPVPVWLVWSVGIVLALSTLYHGIPCVMRIDPTHALGLYFMSSLVVLALAATERFFTAWYLSGHFAPLTNSVEQIAAKLPF
jgi:uncharacterized membrane protein YecN with MAPEG domain